MYKLAVVAALALVAAGAGGWARSTVTADLPGDYSVAVDIQALQVGAKDLPVWEIDSYL